MRAGAVCAKMRCAISRRSLSGVKMRAPKCSALQLLLSFKTRLENSANSSNWVACLFFTVGMLPRSHCVPAKDSMTRSLGSNSETSLTNTEFFINIQDWQNNGHNCSLHFYFSLQKYHNLGKIKDLLIITLSTSFILGRG